LIVVKLVCYKNYVLLLEVVLKLPITLVVLALEENILTAL